MEKYRSAVIAFKSALSEFPDTRFKEDIMFLALKSNYLYAENSVITKKVERFEETIKSYHNFVDSLETATISGKLKLLLVKFKRVRKIKSESNGI